MSAHLQARNTFEDTRQVAQPLYLQTLELPLPTMGCDRHELFALSTDSPAPALNLCPKLQALQIPRGTLAILIGRLLQELTTKTSQQPHCVPCLLMGTTELAKEGMDA